AGLPKDFNVLGNCFSLSSAVWILFSNSAAACREDACGTIFVVSFSDGSEEHHSMLYVLFIVSIVLGLAFGYGLTWLIYNVWQGFVYLLSGIGVVCNIIALVRTIMERV
ncbi:MAG: hypothetical protein K2L72_03180, partial [Clostridia bacterium]|nr:hypothetical protein [Clostridia bacterium]